MHIIFDNLDSQESNLKIVVEEPVASSSSGSIAVNDPIINYDDPAFWPFPLSLVELLGKYDVTMHEHLRRISSQETHVHYCSNTIQNEIITLMGSSVKNTILDRARQAKYSIILDCTPDLSHTEQLSVTIRFVDVSSDVSPKEHFITFRAVHESSDQSLFDIILKVLEELNLDIKDCRGQGYDNGSNIKGKNKGVQARILQINPRAFFMPCSCHSLNLVISDCATSCTESVSFFGVIQKIYTLFSASVGRWKILTDTVPAFTVKPLCTTRWESRIECLKPLRYQVIEIHDALLTLREHGSSDPAIKHEAQTLASQLCDYNFLVMLVIWYDILFRINIVSKSMQSNTMDLGSAVSLMESCAEYIENYRLNGFAKTLVDAKELAKSLDVDPIFVQKRVNRKKRMFNYEHSDETMSDPQNLFKTKIF
ncbi:zinc finger MYM-type protein 1-like [Solenopsis invicta]|uniref:zinc finger MYM-type protein 1-like n=1 Tax=Solenopsis invicta TaxID=13686 RepID=UPI00193D1254|nr:zinc finger MYM-type protein 1-like [Solenopsis invicta]